MRRSRLISRSAIRHVAFYGMAIPVTLAVAAGQSAAKPVAGQPAGAQHTAAAQAQALAAKSHLTTDQLISAARLAGSRLQAHRRPAEPAPVRAHPPIFRSGAGAGANSLLSGPSTAAGTSVSASCPALSGTVTSPWNQGQTSTFFGLAAQLSGGCSSGAGSAQSFSTVTFQYMVGTAGTFNDIPESDVTSGGAPAAWPETTSWNGSAEVSPQLNWFARQTVGTSGVVQVQAVFTDASADSYTTSPVTVTLDVTGTGIDFGTTQVGPATVGLQSGNMSYTATDASIPSFGGALTVSRTFNSLGSDPPSVFGAGWTSSLPALGTTMDWSSVTDDNSYAILTDAGGSILSFVAGTASGGVTPYVALGPAAAQGLALSKSSAGFALTDPSGDQTLFTAAGSGNPTRYNPSQVLRPGTSRSFGYAYAASGQLKLMLAPDPATPAGTPNTTACPYPASVSTWAQGCRGLQFAYDAAGHLTEVDFVAYRSSSTITNVPVAEYAYTSGRLTSEWDPRLGNSFVTTYGYDTTAGDVSSGWLTSITPAQSSGSRALAPWTFTYDNTIGTADYGKVVSVTRTHASGAAATQTLAYEVPLTTSAGGPLDMDSATVGTWDQTDVPMSGTALFPATHVPAGRPASTDWPYAHIAYYDSNGQVVNTANYGFGKWNVTTDQHDGYGDVASSLSAADRAEALAAGTSSPAVAAELETVTEFAAAPDGSQRVTDIYTPLHNASVPGQGVQPVRGHVRYVYDSGAPSTGGPYDLVTSETDTASIGAGIPGTAEADTRTTNTAYSNGTDNIGWTLRTPMRTITDPVGLAVSNTVAYNESSSLYGGEPLVVESCMPADTGCSGAGTQKTIYYTAGSNPTDTACGNQAAWVDLVCKTQPIAQPGTSGLPNLPVTAYTYNLYLSPATKTETFGSATRTTTYTYDGDNRQIGTSTTTSGSGMGAALQNGTYVYDRNSGLLTDVETVNGVPPLGTITGDLRSGYDDFGELTSYTDASGTTSTNVYNLNGQTTSHNDGKGVTSYSYDTSGALLSETDSLVGTITDSQNADGDITAETYPGGFTASYGYDETETPTLASYAGVNWATPLTAAATPNAHGNWTGQTATGAGQPLPQAQAFDYDKADRLTAVQDTLAGQCTTSTYTFNANSDRISRAVAAPAADGSCQTTSPATQNYLYDPADRLTNTGYTYDTQGDITTTPSVDAGGGGDLTATYYANNLLHTQAQAGTSITWTLDPDRNRYAAWTTGAGVTYANHYGDGGTSPAWTSGSDGSWNRFLKGPKGLLAALTNASGTTLELLDLNDNVLATASTSTASTGPAHVYAYSAYGQSEAGAAGSPGGYGWLGGEGESVNALGGQILIGARAYNPGSGIYDQPRAVSGTSNTNSYSYANPPIGDPCSTRSAMAVVRAIVGHNTLAWLQLTTYYCWNGKIVTYHHSTSNPHITGWGSVEGVYFNKFIGNRIDFHCEIANGSSRMCSRNVESSHAEFKACISAGPIQLYCEQAIIGVTEWENMNGGFFYSLDNGWM
jgi:YD repeat-containing protein